jgi:hypothetical protein
MKTAASLESGMIQALAITLDTSGVLPLAKYIDSLESLRAATISVGRAEDAKVLGDFVEALRKMPSAWKQGGA